MAALTIKADGLKPQDASLIIPAEAGSALTLTTPAVTVASDGQWDKTSGASGVAHGLVVSIANKTNTAAAGDTIGVCVMGVVGGFTGLTPGAEVFLAATAGTLDDAGTVSVGYALTTETIMFLPAIAAIAS